MRILITNDDGIAAPGLLALARAASHYGEVRVVAPDRERSACARSMTMRLPLRVGEVPHYPTGRAWEVDGFPVDCVNVGRSIAWPEGCDLVLSGINNGPNLGFDVTYSGTVAGAMEGSVAGIRAIAVSVASLVFGQPLRYDGAQEWLAMNLGKLLQIELPPLTLLNVNVPNLGPGEIGPAEVVPMGRRVFEDRIEWRDDPWGRTYAWQGGVAVLNGEEPGSDVATVRAGRVAVTPISLDWTRYDALDAVRAQLS